nr:MAG TPA_asm: hypothetical protein [Caudoviricetes sp.]
MGFLFGKIDRRSKTVQVSRLVAEKNLYYRFYHLNLCVIEVVQKCVK